jgi:hypothetical protein
MIPLSSISLCRGNDFRCPDFKEDGLSAEKAKGHQVEKSRYVMDMGSFFNLLIIIEL